MKSKQRVAGQVEQLLNKVENMEPGGDLDGLIVAELDALNKVVYDAAIARRAEVTAEQAAFFPSGMSEVQRPADGARRDATEEDQDG